MEGSIECVALTQNFVSTAELPKVLHFLKSKPEQISGFKGCSDADDDASAALANAKLCDEFCDELRKFDTALLERALEKIPSLSARSANDSRAKLQGEVKKRSILNGAHEAQEGSSTFSLAVDGDLELEDVPW